MIVRLRRHLILFARHQVGTISYLTLNQEAELGLNLDNAHEKRQLKELLAEISSTEYAAGRPILSSLVEVKGRHGQGDAFYKLCEQLGLGEWRACRRQENLLRTLRDECRIFWQQDINFQQHSRLSELTDSLDA